MAMPDVRLDWFVVKTKHLPLLLWGWHARQLPCATRG